jgi:glycosyltransferase involved in cell wall biosynthesis
MIHQTSILLCSYHGAAHLAEQLDSINEQTNADWTLRVSDDGSTDDTLSILEHYRSAWGRDRLTVARGPSAGFAANFRSLTCRADIDAGFFAWADQDDIWQPEKLQRALAWLRSLPADVPALYGTRTLLTDAADRPIGISPLFTRPPSFANALVQCIAGCNTMVFNRAARELFVEASSQGDALPPDWLMYLLVSGCGGRVHYDPWPSVRYRQHGQNLSGSNLTVRGRWQRARQLMGGEFRGWVDANLDRLARFRHRMPAHQQSVLDEFVRARQRRLPGRLIGFWRSGIHRQTVLGNIGLIVAALFNKL